MLAENAPHVYINSVQIAQSHACGLHHREGRERRGCHTVYSRPNTRRLLAEILTKQIEKYESMHGFISIADNAIEEPKA